MALLVRTPAGAKRDDPGSDDRRLARLERAGIIRGARPSRLKEIRWTLPPMPERGGDVLAALLDERPDEDCDLQHA